MNIGIQLEKLIFVYSSLHESIVQLSPHQVKQSIEQRWSTSRSNSLSTSKTRITYEEFQNLALPIYLKTIKKIP